MTIDGVGPMRIGELGQAAGVDVQTIRFYEKEALLPPPVRESNGYRSYGPEHLERLMFIRHCRSLDMPLDDVRRLLAIAEHPQHGGHDVHRVIDAHLERVRARLQSLAALESQLVALRGKCGDPGSPDHCGTLDELVDVARRHH